MWDDGHIADSKDFRQTLVQADVLLVRNIKALLQARGLHQNELAHWCGHRPSWINKILSEIRGMPVRDLGKVADFFGLMPGQLFDLDISGAYERRRRNRRIGADRRSGADRRKPKRTN